MRVVVSSGEKTGYLVDELNKIFSSSGIEIIGVDNIDDIGNLFYSGKTFDRAILVEYCWTDDASSSATRDITNAEERQYRYNINSFSTEMSRSNHNKSNYIFLNCSKKMAEIVSDETFSISADSTILVRDGSFTIKLFQYLVTVEIDNITDALLYKPDYADTSDTGTEDEDNADDNNEAITEDMVEPEDISAGLNENTDDIGNGLDDIPDEIQWTDDIPNDIQDEITWDEPDDTQGEPAGTQNETYEAPNENAGADESDWDSFNNDNTTPAEDINDNAGTDGTDSFNWDSIAEDLDDIPSDGYIENNDNQYNNDGYIENNDGYVENNDGGYVENNDTQYNEDTQYNDDNQYDNNGGYIDENWNNGYNEEYSPEYGNNSGYDTEYDPNNNENYDDTNGNTGNQDQNYGADSGNYDDAAHGNNDGNNYDYTGDYSNGNNEGYIDTSGYDDPDNYNDSDDYSNAKVQKYDLNKSQVKNVLSTFASRGTSIMIAGFGGTGASTVAFNIANTICNLGFSVLLVDLDTNNKAQSYISKDSYNSMRTGDSNCISAVNEVDANTYVSVVRHGFHLLSNGMCTDSKDASEAFKADKLSRFNSLTKSSYNFVIYDAQFSDITGGLANLTYNCDDLILVSDASNWGISKTLLGICNIDNAEVISFIFNRAKILLNKRRNIKSILGYKAKTAADILKSMDKKLVELEGNNIGYSFKKMRVCGEIPYIDGLDDCWFSTIQYSDTKDGFDMMSNILQGILFN
ncbi:MAG: hypothetical protein IJ593_01270 [Lachnospiraceae bacterium]|nr:hypothetical protein [Lachnospiraceae bacterium]